MPATVAAARWDADTAPVSPAFAPKSEASRAALYGGLVGDMLGEIEQGMAGPAAVFATETDNGVDVFHRASIAAGYLGLAAGCAATVRGIAALL